MRKLLTLFVLVAALAPLPLRAEETGPPLTVAPTRLANALHCPAKFRTNPTSEPVLLVHGTITDDKYNWYWNYRPALQHARIDVCTVTLPGNSLGDMQVQAEYVVHAVRQIHARTGSKVDMVGASQGTLHPRWAVKYWPDVRAVTDDIVQLAAPNRGTAATALARTFSRCFDSCWQMMQGSNYLNALNAGDPSPGDISYTSIFTWTDELVQPQLPVSTSALEGASNIATQSVCPARPVDHVTLSTGDAVGYALAFDALTHPGPADPARFNPLDCAKSHIPYTDPLSVFFVKGSAKFGGASDYHDHEPPLRPYAS